MDHSSCTSRHCLVMGHDDGPAPMECQQEIQDICAPLCPDCRSARPPESGRSTSARATATRALLASRQLGRPMSRAIHEPDAPRATPWLCHDAASRYTGIDERQLDVSRRGQSRQKIEVLEHEPDPLLRIRLSSSSSSRPTSRPQNRDSRPDVGRSRQPIMFIRSQICPNRTAPFSATHSPASIRGIDPIQHASAPEPIRFRQALSGAPPAGRFRWVHSYRNARSDRATRATRGSTAKSYETDRRRLWSRRSRWPATKTPSSIPRTAQSQSEQDAGQNTDHTADTAS